LREIDRRSVTLQEPEDRVPWESAFRCLFDGHVCERGLSPEDGSPECGPAWRIDLDGGPLMQIRNWCKRHPKVD
jgi:hypothetical protein